MDTIAFFILLPVTLLLLFLAFIILKGRGDGLIAGYNTASEEEREKYDAKRLRVVVAAMLLFVTVLIWVPAFLDDGVDFWLVIMPIILIAVVASLIIVNTWCKKK